MELEKHWCMCTELDQVYRDCFSTCSICGGKDAYGKSPNRTEKYKKLVCMCKHNKCTSNPCKGECGCEKCHNDYQDFLSEE